MDRNQDPRPYRANVAALITDGHGRILAGERGDIAGAWQVPQGGVDSAESEEEALRRELREELGIRELTILARSMRTYSYDFRPELGQRDITRRFRGQKQRFFVVALPEGDTPDPAQGDGEFRAVAWLSPDDLLARIAPFKYAALAAALSELAPFLGGPPAAADGKPSERGESA